jgi:hypothetical protein
VPSLQVSSVPPSTPLDKMQDDQVFQSSNSDLNSQSPSHLSGQGCSLGIEPSLSRPGTRDPQMTDPRRTKITDNLLRYQMQQLLHRKSRGIPFPVGAPLIACQPDYSPMTDLFDPLLVSWWYSYHGCHFQNASLAEGDSILDLAR